MPLPKNVVVVGAEAVIAIAQAPVVHGLNRQMPIGPKTAPLKAGFCAGASPVDVSLVDATPVGAGLTGLPEYSGTGAPGTTSLMLLLVSLMRYRTEVAALPSTCNIVAVQRFKRGRLVFALSDRYRVIDLGMGKSPVLVLQATP